MADAMALTPETIVHRSERTAARTVGGKALVVVIDRNELHSLNETGTFVWEQCQGRTVRELVALLSDRYGLDDAQAQADVDAFLRSMYAVDALRLETP